MTDAELYTLIQSDPEALTAYTASNDDECAARCSEIAPTLTQSVPAVQIRLLLASRKRLAQIKRVADNVAAPEPPYDACATLITLLEAGDAIDLANPTVAESAATLRAHNLLSEDDSAAIAALAVVRQTITQQQVGAAREWHRVTGGVSNGTT